MNWMLARQKVVDFPQWKRVFDSHAQAHEKAGLKLIHVLRNMDNPNDVVVLFEVADVEKAKGFVTSPDVPEAKNESGVIGDTEICLLTS